MAATPAVPALLAQNPVPAPVPGVGRAGGRGVGRGGAPTDPPKIPLADAGETSEGGRKFFTAAQFATLKKLGSILLPPLKGNIGAMDCDSAEFLDFLVGASPADRQLLYRNGLNGLEAQARKQFGKGFVEMDSKQADAILQPLMTQVPWVYDLPKDPMKRFVYQVHADFRTATRNSSEAAAALANSGRRGAGGGGLYWNPIDPV